MALKTYQGGDASLGTSWSPAGVPVDGDTVDTAGLPITFTADATIGLDDGSAAITNPTQFPASAEAAPITVAAGVTLTLRGRVENSNGDLNLMAGAKIVYTNSDAQVQDHGNFDNATTAPTLSLQAGSVIEFAGSGSMVGTMNGGGAVISDGGIIAGFGDGTNVFTANIQSDASQCFCARPLYFVRSKGRLDIQCYGDGTMGDIEVTGLYNIDPVSGGDIRFSGNVDKTLNTTANKRIAQNIRSEGASPELLFMQGYTSVRGFRTMGSPLTNPGDRDAQDLTEWFTGNHGGSFMRAIGSHQRSIFRDVTDNPHLISLARLNSLTPRLGDNVFIADGIQDSSDTGDCYATDAANSAVDFTVDGQVILLENDLVIAGPHTGPADGPIYLTCNGELGAGLHVQFQPKIRILQLTGRFSNGGIPINFDESGITPEDTVTEFKRNICSNHDLRAPMAVCGLKQGFALAQANPITAGQSDENVFHNYPDGLGIKHSGAANDAATLSSAPDFGDPDRNLRTWAERIHGITEAEAIINLVRAGFPGYGVTPAVPALDYDVERLRQWIRAGHVDRNVAHAGRGISDAPPKVITDANAGAPIVDGLTVTLTVDADLNVSHVHAHSKATGERTIFTPETKPATNQEAATAVQGNHPHGQPVTVGANHQ